MQDNIRDYPLFLSTVPFLNILMQNILFKVRNKSMLILLKSANEADR